MSRKTMVGFAVMAWIFFAATVAISIATSIDGDRSFGAWLCAAGGWLNAASQYMARLGGDKP